MENPVFALTISLHHVLLQLHRQIQFYFGNQSQGTLLAHDGKSYPEMFFDLSCSTSCLILTFVQELLLALDNLLEQELAEIARLMEFDESVLNQFPSGLADPCPKFCQVLEDFMSWYFKVRAQKHTEPSILNIALLGN